MDLLDLRNQIDDIDEQIIPLLLKRMDVSRQVAEYKIKRGIPVLNEQREKEILDDIHKKCGEDGDIIATVFSATMDASREIQHKIINGGGELKTALKNARADKNDLFKCDRVACAGIDGSYTMKTAKLLFPGAEIMCCRQFEDVFEAVDKGETGFGVIPVENSSAGSVHESYDLIMKYKFYFVGSYSMKIEHCFAAPVGVRYEDIKNVYSHPQALSQCSRFLKNFDFTGINFSNTAAAAKYIVESGKKDAGVLCSVEAAKKYKLNILKRNVQNIEINQTRFVVISKKLLIADGANKISIIFSLPHTTGSLYRVLGRFSMTGLNLTKLESRPIGNGDFSYYFYVDLEGSVQNEKTLDLLCALSQELPDFKFLGNYYEY
ncbi:MAG: chorismate mutase [Clostridiales bacterium]|nr:chorismate mutase [Clostridiales bacterium]